MFKKEKYERLKNYEKILNKKDPLDKQILKLIKDKELSVGLVEVNKPKYNTLYNINLDALSKSERAYFIGKKKFFKFNIKQ